MFGKIKQLLGFKVNDRGAPISPVSAYQEYLDELDADDKSMLTSAIVGCNYFDRGALLGATHLAFLNYFMGIYSISGCDSLKEVWKNVIYNLYFIGSVGIIKLDDRFVIGYLSSIKTSESLEIIGGKVEFNYNDVPLEIDISSPYVVYGRINIFNLPLYYEVKHWTQPIAKMYSYNDKSFYAGQLRALIKVPQGASNVLKASLQQVMASPTGDVFNIVYDDKLTTNAPINPQNYIEKVELDLKLSERCAFVDWKIAQAKANLGIDATPPSMQTKQDHGLDKEFDTAMKFSKAIENNRFTFFESFIKMFNDRFGENAVLNNVVEAEVEAENKDDGLLYDKENNNEKDNI